MADQGFSTPRIALAIGRPLPVTAKLLKQAQSVMMPDSGKGLDEKKGGEPATRKRRRRKKRRRKGKSKRVKRQVTERNDVVEPTSDATTSCAGNEDANSSKVCKIVPTECVGEDRVVPASIDDLVTRWMENPEEISYLESLWVTSPLKYVEIRLENEKQECFEKQVLTIHSTQSHQQIKGTYTLLKQLSPTYRTYRNSFKKCNRAKS